jgi:hypothetical protein
MLWENLVFWQFNVGKLLNVIGKERMGLYLKLTIIYTMVERLNILMIGDVQLDGK